jgi:glycosyltransferase involved in cell wall biosynthesis
MAQQPAAKKRVLMLLTNAFEPDPRVHQEAKSLVENGYCVTIVCWDRDCKFPPQEVIEGIKIERIHVRSTHGRGSTQAPFLLLFWVKAYARASNKGFDIVHCHDFDTVPLGYLLAKQKKSKLVYDAHESYVDMLENLPRFFKKIIYAGENFLLRRADLLITVGETLKEAFKQRGAKRTCVVGNWKDPEAFVFPEEVLKAEKRNLKILNGQLVISFISNLGRERQLPQLIRAVADSPGLFLIIGGDGPCKEIAAEAHQHYPNIVYLGRVPPSRVPIYTAISDIIFYGFDPKNPNSKFSAPNKLFEALAAGKAVLTGDIGEIGKIVKDKKCGLILNNFSEQEIKKIFLELRPDVLNRCKENALRSALNRYNWGNASSILLTMYGSLQEPEC